MSTDQALIELGEQTSEAVQGILKMFSATGVIGGDIRVVQPGDSPFEALDWPAIAADVSYTNGVSGGNVFVIGVAGARKLAAAMTGADPDSIAEADDLDEIEYSAVGEAMNQMMAATAMATGAVLEDDVEIGAPEIKRVATAAEAAEIWDHQGHATQVSFTFCGEQCMLIQLVPNAFIMRMTRALDERSPAGGDGATLSSGMQDVRVRVWAELGRTQMASGRAVELPPGVVIELDRLVDDAADVYVDGMRFASCRLLVMEDGGLAMKLETIYGLDLGGGEPVEDDPGDGGIEPEPDEAEVAA